MSNDIGLTVEGPGASDWILAEAALSGVIAQRYREYTSALGTYESDVILVALRALERVSHAILEAVYPDTSLEDEGEDGIDQYKRERDISEALTVVDDHGYSLISVGGR